MQDPCVLACARFFTDGPDGDRRRWDLGCGGIEKPAGSRLFSRKPLKKFCQVSSVHPNPAAEIENFEDLKKNCKNVLKTKLFMILVKK
jgi:hypothetical protein